MPRALLALVAVAALLPAGCPDRKPGSEAGTAATSAVTTAATTTAKVYTRDELRAMLMGKTTGEVIAAIGRPHNTLDTGNSSRWDYRHISHDPVTGKADPGMVVHFTDGKVTMVSF